MPKVTWLIVVRWVSAGGARLEHFCSLEFVTGMNLGIIVGSCIHVGQQSFIVRTSCVVREFCVNSSSEPHMLSGEMESRSLRCGNETVPAMPTWGAETCAGIWTEG